MVFGGYCDTLRACFPRLTISCIKYIGGGTFRVFEVRASADSDGGSTVDDNITNNRRLVFSFPHGGEGDELLRRERRLCGALAPILPVPVPRYSYIHKAASSSHSPLETTAS